MTQFISKIRRRCVVVSLIGVMLSLILLIGLLRRNPTTILEGENPWKATNLMDVRISSSSFPTTNTLQIPVRRDPTGALALSIQTTLEGLRIAPRTEVSRSLLQRLRADLMTTSSQAEAVRAIVQFLDAGEDAKTGLRFRVGPKHVLSEAPTLRTALLDWFGEIHPGAAAEYAQSLFESTASAEEYALGLRNFALGRPEAREELRDRFAKLLANTGWRDQPAAGYLESLDLAPYLADAVFVGPLSGFLTSSPQRSLRHASLIALDRLVLANPSGVLQEILNSSELAKQPLTRAAFFARADSRDPGQIQLIERYLLSRTVSDQELEKFIELFPNANGFVSYNLLTELGGRDLADLAAQDAATLEQLRKWREDVRFTRLEPRLARLENRLRQHVESAIRGGYLSRR
jgi:hypothetical protein